MKVTEQEMFAFFCQRYNPYSSTFSAKYALHGTTEDRVPKIKLEGLLPECFSDSQIHVTESSIVALRSAEWWAKERNFQPVIFLVNLQGITHQCLRKSTTCYTLDSVVSVERVGLISSDLIDFYLK